MPDLSKLTGRQRANYHYMADALRRLEHDLHNTIEATNRIPLEWHEIAQAGKTAAIVAEGANMANSGRSNDPRLELFKQNLGYYLSVMAAMLDG